MAMTPDEYRAELSKDINNFEMGKLSAGDLESSTETEAWVSAIATMLTALSYSPIDSFTQEDWLRVQEKYHSVLTQLKIQERSEWIKVIQKINSRFAK